jgi:CelD/BcsL family acetyltransferase involved in cellulose biosynthesis
MFLTEVSAGLLRAGALRLYWLELDGEPVAAEYHIRDGATVYAYQSGIDPDKLTQQPGQLITLATLREAIAEGAQAFDFLRGDEAYKAHWRAAPMPSWDLRITPNKSKARLRHSLWVASDNVKSLIKSGLKLSGLRG